MNGASSCEDEEDAPAQFASPPCFMHELDPSYRSGPIDAQQARDVARWRKSERERLIAARLALPDDERAGQTRRIARELDGVAALSPGAIAGVYWPVLGEPDLRPWMYAAHERGIRLALPTPMGASEPGSFREWWPGAPLERGFGDILFPAAGNAVIPTVIIAPLVGFDPACYRLGYGGGFFDRVLGAIRPKPLAIGAGYSMGLLATIYPQAHDVPMDWIITGSGTLRPPRSL